MGYSESRSQVAEPLRSSSLLASDDAKRKNSHFTKVERPMFQATRGFSTAGSCPSNQDSQNKYLFVVVSWKYYSRCFTSIIQLDTTQAAGKYDPEEDAPVFDSELSVSFRLPGQEPLPRGLVHWGCSLLPSPSPTEAALLHMVPDWACGTRSPEADIPLNSFIFNLKTKELIRIRPPHSVHKHGGLVVNPSLRGHTYFIAHPNDHLKPPGPAFERYDPLNDEWKELEPIPQAAITNPAGFKDSIDATAVWVDDGATILFNVFGHHMWAYNVDKNKWYPVKWPPGQHSEIQWEIVGEAIVLGNTIYALSKMHFDKVVALSIEKKVGKSGDPVYKCSLSEIILVPGWIGIEFEYEPEDEISRHLVHLGGVNFCLIHSQSCETPGDIVTYQHVQLTNMKLTRENSMTVTNKCVHRFKLEPYAQFQVRQCFSLPRNKTTDLKQGETLFTFNPYPEGFWSGQAAECEGKSYPSHRKPVQEEDNVTLPKDVQELDAKSNIASKVTHANEKADDEGHSFCVVKFSSYATVGDLVYVLESFGSVKSCHIQVSTNKMTGKHCAYVEFESKTSKQRAIKASPIEIGGRRGVIQKLGRNVGVLVPLVVDLLEIGELAAALAFQPVSAQAASRGGHGGGGRLSNYQGDSSGRGGGGGMEKYNALVRKLRPESSATFSTLETTLQGKRYEVNSHHN